VKTPREQGNRKWSNEKLKRENTVMETRVVKSEENNKEKPPHKDSSDPKMELKKVKEIKGQV
jgi:hypothetical protein